MLYQQQASFYEMRVRHIVNFEKISQKVVMFISMLYSRNFEEIDEKTNRLCHSGDLNVTQFENHVF
jgi:uncharacterized protein YaiI (UPF0178 family)